MVAMRSLFVMLSLFIIQCHNDNEAFHEIKIDGQVEFLYMKKSDSFWLKKIVYREFEGKEYSLTISCDEISRIMEICDIQSKNLLSIRQSCNELPLHKTNMFFLHQFRTQPENPNDVIYENLIHKGGDIFSLNDTSLVISFHLLGSGILIENVCHEYVVQKNMMYIDCPLSPDSVIPPFIVLNRIDSSTSFSDNWIREKSLNRFDHDEFLLGVCE